MVERAIPWIKTSETGGFLEFGVCGYTRKVDGLGKGAARRRNWKDIHAVND
jgi:hypothetical protein